MQETPPGPKAADRPFPMEFSLDRFYTLNRRVIIWVVLFALIYVLRGFFTLIFLTFIIAFFSFPASKFLMDRFLLNRVAAISAVHMAVFVGYVALVWWISPDLVGEIGALSEDLGNIENSIIENRESYLVKYPQLKSLIDDFLPPDDTEKDIREVRTFLQERLPGVVTGMFTFGMKILLAILFSLLITLDYARLVKQIQSLRSSKLRDFYEEAGQPVVKCALAVGRGFKVIAVIALITTIFITIGLWGFGVPSIVLLAVIVFLSSLVPVAGVFIEAGAVVLVTLNEYGMERAMWVLGMIIAVHVAITYTITPILFGRHFKMNPVLVLIVLFLGQQFFGVWGLILGVPVANYLIRDVFAVPIVEEIAATREEEKSKPELKIKREEPPIGAEPSSVSKG